MTRLDAIDPNIAFDGLELELGSLAFSFHPAALSVEQMFNLRAGLGTVHDVLSGLVCQPRFSVDGEGGRVLNSLWETLGWMCGEIIAEASSRAPNTDRERALLVSLLAEEWVDGSLHPTAALKGLGETITRLVDPCAHTKHVEVQRP